MSFFFFLKKLNLMICDDKKDNFVLLTIFLDINTIPLNMISYENLSSHIYIIIVEILFKKTGLITNKLITIFLSI